MINQEVAKELLQSIVYVADIANIDEHQTIQHIRLEKVGDVYIQLPINGLTVNATKDNRQKCLDSGMNDSFKQTHRPRSVKSKIHLIP
jgi:CheY-like chemotaxis protein